MRNIRSQARGAHLVGGLAVPNATSAMHITSHLLGKHIDAVTDGEIGLRSQWIQWQVPKLLALFGIDMIPGATKDMPSGTHQVYHNVFPVLTVDPSVTALPTRHLGYADAAEDSYLIFRQLRHDGVIPEGVQFQVSLPTPLAVVGMFVAEADQERFLSVYEAAMAAEIRAIVGFVDLDDLAIQFDLAVEVGALIGAFPVAFDKVDIIRALDRAFAMIPSPVTRKGHLCYGDLLHQHFVVPDDLSLCVEIANLLDLDLVHMPVDRDTGRNPEYFEPLRVFNARRKKLALGVVDYEGDEDRTRELIDAAVTGTGGDFEFSVATECGLARLGERGDSVTLNQLLELHARVAYPVR